jgi:hypothetical protein
VSAINLSLVTRALVDTAAPEHTRLRYHDQVICTDDNRLGGLNADFTHKEWRCKRCVLLDIIEGREILDPQTLEDCGPPEVRIEVYNRGNVR